MADTPDLKSVAKRNYLKAATDFPDCMIEHGRDRYGDVHSPLFAVLLTREDPPEIGPYPIFDAPAQYEWQKKLESPFRMLCSSTSSRAAGARVDIMGCDLIGAYRQTDGRIYTTHNEPRPYPDTERPWMGMHKRFLVHWWQADRPSGNMSMPVEDWATKQNFAYAYRTAVLVRGKHPFVLIIDDIKKDEEPREYNWSMMIPQDIYEAKSYELTDRHAILTDPADRTKHLLILPIDGNGNSSFDTKAMYGEWRDKKGHVYKRKSASRLSVLIARSTPARAASFRMKPAVKGLLAATGLARHWSDKPARTTKRIL